MRKLVYLLMLGIICILSTQVMAAVISMTAGDAGNNSSFYNTGGSNQWSPNGLPTAGNDYYTCGNLLRSPATGSGYLTGNYTFAGDKLVIGYSSTGVAPVNTFNSTNFVNNDCLIFKTTPQTLTVNNLWLDAGCVRDGNGDNNVEHLAGNIYVTPNGGAFACQSLLYIDSAITGPGPVYIGGAGNSYTAFGPRGIIFTSATTTNYNGNIIFSDTQGNGGYAQLKLDVGSVMNFVPTTNGVTNSIYGTGNGGMLTANGTFNINTGGADTTLGNLWQLVGPLVSTPTGGIYGGDATFNVAGFTNESGGYWAQAIPSTSDYFVFNENNGTLSVMNVVPEPATWIMLVLGAMGIAFYSRKK